jgi:hypothetical protein
VGNTPSFYSKCATEIAYGLVWRRPDLVNDKRVVIGTIVASDAPVNLSSQNLIGIGRHKQFVRARRARKLGGKGIVTNDMEGIGSEIAKVTDQQVLRILVESKANFTTHATAKLVAHGGIVKVKGVRVKLILWTNAVAQDCGERKFTLQEPGRESIRLDEIDKHGHNGQTNEEECEHRDECIGVDCHVAPVVAQVGLTARCEVRWLLFFFWTGKGIESKKKVFNFGRQTRPSQSVLH